MGGRPISKIAEIFYAAGFTDLVPVIRDEKRPGVLEDGRWHGIDDWPEIQASLESVREWDEWNANVGLKAKHFPAIDIDVDDPTLTNQIHSIANVVFGATPVRKAGPARKLLIFRTTEEIRKKILKLTKKDLVYKIEILGDGQQYVIGGRHPEGYEYSWDQIPDPEKIPYLTEEKLKSFFDMVSGFARGLGWSTADLSKNKAAFVRKELEAPSLEILEEHLGYLPNNARFAERDDWFEIVAAIRGAGGEAAEDLAVDWSLGWDSPNTDPITLEDNTRKAFQSVTEPKIGWPLLRDICIPPPEVVFDIAKKPSYRPDIPEVSNRIQFTDDWVIAMILPQLEGRILYDTSSKGQKWFIWNGKYWQLKSKEKTSLATREAIRKLAIWLITHPHAGRSEGKCPYVATANKICQQRPMEHIRSGVREYLGFSPDELDPDPMLLNTAGGLIDLHTGDVRPSVPEDLVSKYVQYSPRLGPALKFQGFLDDLTGGDSELQEFLQVFTGYCLTGKVTEKILLFGYGSDTDTGKSTFVKLLRLLMGTYTDSVDIETFMLSAKNRYNLARLPAKRLVVSTEPESKQIWQAGFIKSITGGDALEARGIYGSPFTFLPQFKLFIVGNHEPEFTELDKAIARRVLIVPMNHRIPKAKQIKDFEEILMKAEGSQILHWALNGCIKWQKDGLHVPDSVRITTKEYRDDSDTLQQWMDERCDLSNDGWLVKNVELYGDYQFWCRSYGIEPGKAKTFHAQLRDKGFVSKAYMRKERYEGKQVRGYLGLKLGAEID